MRHDNCLSVEESPCSLLYGISEPLLHRHAARGWALACGLWRLKCCTARHSSFLSSISVLQQGSAALTEWGLNPQSCCACSHTSCGMQPLPSHLTCFQQQERAAMMQCHPEHEQPPSPYSSQVVTA